jgi:hypothetical protein
LLVVTFVVIVLTWFPSRATDLGTVKGTVTDAVGATLDQAVVRLERWDTNKNTMHPVIAADLVVYTDRKGQYSIRVSPGLYDVFVSSRAFTPVAKKIRVGPNVEVDFSPELKFDPLVEFVE